MSDVLPTWRAWRVWQRNATTYRRTWVGNLLGHLADPLFYVAVVGFGLGSYMPPIDGVPYISFVVAGVVAGSAMPAACFETSYGSFLRMRVQGTFDAILATPVSASDLAAGEVLWAATKGMVSAAATMVIGLAFGLFEPGAWLVWALGVVLLQGCFFGGISLTVASRVRALGTLNHFYALFIMSVFFLSGVFFPLDVMPDSLRAVAHLNPLTHAVHLIRPLSVGQAPPGWPLEILWLAIAAALGMALGVANLRRQMVI